jgi:hypothetical protein
MSTLRTIELGCLFLLPSLIQFLSVLLEFDLHLDLVRGTKSTPHTLIGVTLFCRVVDPYRQHLRRHVNQCSPLTDYSERV